MTDTEVGLPLGSEIRGQSWKRWRTCLHLLTMRKRRTIRERSARPAGLIPQVVHPDGTSFILKFQLFIPKTAAAMMGWGVGGRFSGGTSGVKSDAEPAAKSIQTLSFIHTHTQTRTHRGHTAFSSSGLSTLWRQCGWDVCPSDFIRKRQRLFTSLHHFLQPLYHP